MSIATPKILLIEDNRELSQVLWDMLQQGQPAPFNSIRVNSLEKAMQRLGAGDVEASVLDLGLPDSAGLESLRRFRAEFPGLPMGVLTGFENEKGGLQALREGAQDYLLKSENSRNMVVRSSRF